MIWTPWYVGATVIIVSNTSSIINLAAIGQLELLHHLYGTIVIPDAVYHEVAVSRPTE